MARSSDSHFILAIFRDQTFKAREIRRVIGLSLLYLAVTTVLIGVFYQLMISRLVDGMAPLLFVSEDMALTNDALPSMSAVLSRWMLVMLAVNAVVTIGVSMYISRKLGHPILAIKRALREIGDGNLDVRLRTNDRKEFGEIADALNTAMNSIRQQVHEAKNSIEKVNELRQTQSPEADYSEMNEALSHCKSALDFFDLSTGVDIQLDDADDDDDAAGDLWSKDQAA